MSNKNLDYNSVKWEDHFYLDVTSPSGLSRKVYVYAGRQHMQLKYKAGTPVGNKRWKKGGRPSGWRLMFEGTDYMVHRIIYVIKHGVIDNNMCLDHLDGNPFNNCIDNLLLKTNQQNLQNVKLYENNTSGIKGVHLCEQYTAYESRRYWTAQWYNQRGCRRSKAFSVNKHGYENAKQLAIEHRNLQISLLNAAGASYTPRHCGLTPAEPPVPSSIQPA